MSLVRLGRQGVVLIIVLWILAILSILAVGLGNKTSVEIALTKHYVNKLKAKYFAWAGFIYSVDQIRIDSEDSNTDKMDNLYQCAIRLESGQSAEELFKSVPVAGGDFTVSFPDPDRKTRYGIADEERRININALQPFNYSVLKNLLVVLGEEENIAETIAASVLDWQDADDTVTGNTSGAEDNYYAGLIKSYLCKNKSFDHIEELLMVKGVTPEIFKKIKDYVTVFPKGGNLLVNIDTAPEPVLQALARQFAGAATNTDISDADSLVKKMLSYRSGKDGEEGTKDDVLIDAGMPMNQKETVIFLTMGLNRAASSKYLRVLVTGTEANTSVHSAIDAVIERSNLSVLEWKRN